MKKKWSNPSVQLLNISLTKFEDDKDKKYFCFYCSKGFNNWLEKEFHEETCFCRPPVPGGELPDMSVDPGFPES